ncbi:FecR family protein [Pedobacter nutrimenti]|jgi:ferric-dicitrate binding protein FerR (iron transport regulator)|uniref:FecR family protein n=1 Tax=Pedobacter nutrimenti TaxID=1241337 RepID=A0A318UB09_9SPHI|nr:FecR family protein [Pedobacter nutrimenti]PYF72620.1 FecR family protein [Pedobacter nutrimenti]
MEEKEQLKYLYRLYLTNLCTEEELKKFFSLLNEQKYDKEMMALLSHTWDNLEVRPEGNLSPESLLKENTDPKIITLKPERKRGFTIWKIAAAILLVVGAGYLYRTEVLNMVSPVHERQLLSAAGERRQLLLPDGTRVWLGPGSRLDYPNRFNGEKRMVKLEGEAFFDVVHDSNQPFIIQTDEVSTTVLGTSFNVRAYKGKENVEVTLVTGKVAVALKNKGKTLQNTIENNQQIIVNKADFSLVKRNYPNASSYLNKRIGVFDYNGESLEFVVNDLKAQYGVEINIEPALLTRSFYGELKMTDSLEHTLNKLSTVMETKWSKSEGKYVIKE